ncbi:hypothetical protein C8R45DRAFT_1099049 [Mycena sanguinolenta]|nr:hypothetical protein C8R45DRAFT_1099049 [Mycena sanguinolenta]
MSFFRGRVYPAVGELAIYPIPVTQIQPLPTESHSMLSYHYPSVEAVMMQTVPEYPRMIHEIVVWILHRLPSGKLRYSKFRCFFKRDGLLPRNGALQIRGDLVVMKSAARTERYVVDLRRVDQHLVNLAVNTVVPKIREVQGSARAEVPKLMTACMPGTF